VTPFEEVELIIEELLKQGELKSLIESEIKSLRERASVELFI
jgi:hypothetical protein